MNKQKTLYKILISALIALFFTMAISPLLIPLSQNRKVVAAIDSLGDIIEISPEPISSSYAGNTKYINSRTVSAKTTTVNPSNKFFYATAFNLTNTANWYKANTVVWKEGDRITFTEQQNTQISFAFIVVHQKAGTEFPSEIKYSDLTNTSFVDNTSIVKDYTNVNILTQQSLTVIPYFKDADGNELQGQSALPQRLYVPLKVYFKIKKFDSDSANSGDIKEIKDGNGNIISPSLWQNGYEINPLDYSEVTQIKFTVVDKANKETSFFTKTGYVPADNISFTEEFRPVGGIIANAVKAQANTYKVAEATLAGINARLVEYSQRYQNLKSSVDLFEANYNNLTEPSKLYSLQGDEYVSTLNRMAAAVVKCQELYDGLNVEGQKQAADSSYVKFNTYINEFNVARLSSAKISITLKDLGSYTKDVDFYSCYIVGTEEFFEKDIPKSLSEALKSDIEFSEKYSFKIMRNGEDVTSEYLGKKIDIKILISPKFNPEKQIYPAGSIFQEGIFTTPIHNTANGYAYFQDITLHNDTAIYISLKAGLSPWLIAGIIVISLIVVGGGIFAVIIVYKKKSKNPEEKLKHLQDEVQKKMRMQDIAKKAKQEEEETNKKYQEQIEKERLEAIEKVKAERKKKLMEKGDLLVQEAQKTEEERSKQELLEYEKMAQEKMKEAQEQADKGGKKKTKKSSPKKQAAGKAANTKTESQAHSSEVSQGVDKVTQKSNLKSKEKKQKAQQIKSKKK